MGGVSVEEIIQNLRFLEFIKQKYHAQTHIRILYPRNKWRWCNSPRVVQECPCPVQVRSARCAVRRRALSSLSHSLSLLLCPFIISILLSTSRFDPNCLINKAHSTYFFSRYMLLSFILPIVQTSCPLCTLTPSPQSFYNGVETFT